MNNDKKTVPVMCHNVGAAKHPIGEAIVNPDGSMTLELNPGTEAIINPSRRDGEYWIHFIPTYTEEELAKLRNFRPKSKQLEELQTYSFPNKLRDRRFIIEETHAPEE